MITNVYDLVSEQDVLKAHEVSFRLWPRQWTLGGGAQVYTWQVYKLSELNRPSVPQRAGLYTLVVQPGIFGHPLCSYLMYVGKTNSLHRRFGEYLREMNQATGRKKIVRLLNKYFDYVWFCFTEIPESEISRVEDALLEAFMPPFNDRFPASVSRIITAF